MKKVLIGIDFSKEKFDVAIIVKSTSTQEHALFDNKVWEQKAENGIKVISD